MGTTIIEYIRNTLKRVRKKESNLIMASQNLEDFDREGIRELTKPLFAIPPHQFIFNCGSIDKRFYMDLLQLEEAEMCIRDRLLSASDPKTRILAEMLRYFEGKTWIVSCADCQEAFGILVDAEMREAFGLDEQEQIGPKLEM